VLRLRAFGPNDIPAVAGVVKASLRENYPATIYLDIHKWWRDGFIVGELDGHIIGFVAGVNNAPHNARILMLAVLEPYRRRGIGSTLMDAFLRQCALRTMRTVELEVRVSNETAIRFYKRYGFQIAGTLPRFYTDGEDGYKMVRHL
jgi:[ribosomal protein S18]-alanine N-acetyltransferase